jgi:hypothetical protein
MSWIQVYVTGMEVDATVESVEKSLLPLLLDTYWAGEGTTVVKHSAKYGASYSFLAFFTSDGALAAIGRIEELTAWHAELVQPKADVARKTDRTENQLGETDAIRLRRRRAKPKPKHPVKISSGRPKKQYS